MLGSLILYDIVFFLLASGVYGGALTGFVWLLLWSLKTLPWYLWGFELPVLVLLTILLLLCEIALLRLLLPRLKAGYHEAPLSKGFYLWTLHLSLNRLITLQPLQNIILYFAGLRWLAFRALGGRVAYASSISANVDFVDIPMIEIGAGSVVGAQTMLTGHFLNKKTLYLGQIKIGERVNIGGYCRISPGVEIGADSWIGAECILSPMVHVGTGCTIEPLTVVPPGTRIPDGQNYPPVELA